MSFLLDQDIYAAALRGNPLVTSRWTQNLGRLHVSAVTVTMLEMWLVRSRTPSRYLQAYGTLMSQAKVLSVDDAVARRAARVGSRLRSQGQPLPLVALLIAGTALEHNLTLVTHHTQLFAPVPGLPLADWLVP